jgi:hypothetical protein
LNRAKSPSQPCCASPFCRCRDTSVIPPTAPSQGSERTRSQYTQYREMTGKISCGHAAADKWCQVNMLGCSCRPGANILYQVSTGWYLCCSDNLAGVTVFAPELRHNFNCRSIATATYFNYQASFGISGSRHPCDLIHPCIRCESPTHNQFKWGSEFEGLKLLLI